MTPYWVAFDEVFIRPKAVKILDTDRARSERSRADTGHESYGINIWAVSGSPKVCNA